VSKFHLRIAVGIQFLLGVVLLNIPYAMLASRFRYPGILRLPPGEILAQFHQGGDALVWIWFGFAWTGFPIVTAMLLLPHALGGRPDGFLRVGTFLGLVGGILQMVGLLRWTFVVPMLAATYVDPASGPALREATVLAFRTIHQYGGVVLGEHLGQVFTILWIFMTSLSVVRSKSLPAWLGIFGWCVCGVYLLAQCELLSTVLPGVPTVPKAGLVGSLLWLGWMVALGATLLFHRPGEVPQTR
jgi:Domain of unknown function (DUF4386)